MTDLDIGPGTFSVMFEYHGWITVQHSAGDGDDTSALHDIVERLRRRLDDLASPYLADLRWMNGVPFLHLAGHPNHRSPDVDQFFALFAEVGEIATGSYGVLYARDDEDPGHENEFRVFRMARGEVSEYPDPLLSPCAPTIEDEQIGAAVRDATPSSPLSSLTAPDRDIDRVGDG